MKFITIPFIIAIFLIGIGFTFEGDSQKKSITIIIPFQPDSISYDQGKTILVSAAKDADNLLFVSTQWETEKIIDISTKAAKDVFVKEFYKIFEPKTTIEMISYTFKFFRGYAPPESLTFAYADTMSIRALWQKPIFIDFVKKVQTINAAEAEVIIFIKGWKDSLYSTTFEDPNGENRSLYKLNIQLISGINKIYFSTSMKKNLAIEYYTNYINETKPADSGTTLFHNSALEQSCINCHEGLPSADSGASMKADCNICHKAIVGATFIHSPVEMKECSSCHNWSAEKHAVVVEKGVPQVCYECHSDKQAQVDSSTTPHPIAGECLTCHSQHGTEHKHLLKQNVYTLCTNCHNDYKINHPVGRHPLRYAKIKNTSEEISCVSCHNPHGSQNEGLLKATGGRMESCTQCH